jgi:hypothetical protein
MVTNNSVADPLTLTSLEDDVYGNLVGQGTCLLTTIAVGGSYSCEFYGNVTGNAGESHIDTVTAKGQDDEGNEVQASWSATVNLTNSMAAIRLVKTADPASVNEPGGNVTYTFTIYNDSSVDSVTITSLTDTIYGNLTAAAGSTCVVPQLIAPLGSYSCQITELVSGDPGGGVGQGYDYVQNVATASGVDDDGYPVPDATDDALVNIVNMPPDAHLTKAVTQMAVSYTVTVCNDSSAEQLYLQTLTDNQFGNLSGKGNCAAPRTIAIGACYSCSFTEVVTTSPHTDTVTGTVSDNEGGFVTPTPTGSATVTFGSP